ncbi:MAG: hypothetical protein LBQ74_14670 [Prevotella sp.]|jgi:hypothetical protein|nr:hypothetical protein [Prevotella sp.]
MKPQWTNLENAIRKHADILQQFIDNVTDPKTIKNLNYLLSGYNKILSLTDEFTKLVEPIAPLQLKLPFDTPVFAEHWALYKEYMLEQFGTYMFSRKEKIILGLLKKWSNNSPDKAIEILEFLIANGYKKFFQPTEAQLSGRDLPPEEQANTSIDFSIDKSTRI